MSRRRRDLDAMSMARRSPMNLLEQQAANRRRTWLVLAMFFGLLLFLGFGFDYWILELGGSPVPVGAIGALMAGSVFALVAYFAGDRAVLLSAGAVTIEEANRSASTEDERFKLRQLENVIEEMAIAAGLPKPRAFIVPDPDPNAFATGRDPAHASIAVTRGLLDVLSREELQGVISHEMSHVRNHDTRVMTLVAALVGAVALLSDWAARGVRFGGASRKTRSRGRGGGAGVMLVVLWLVAVALAPLFARLLAMAVSRRREYLADASGAELTRNPLSLASALEKIEFVADPTKAIKRGSAHLCIADPLGRTVSQQEGFWADLLATHPPMAKRIAALRDMAYQPAFRPSPQPARW